MKNEIFEQKTCIQVDNIYIPFYKGRIKYQEYT